MLSVEAAEKLTTWERNSSEKPRLKAATASRTSSVATEPATGETVAGTSVMSRQPSASACASAASFTDWPSEATILVGWIQMSASPRYQAIEPVFMTTSASTCCSTISIRRVWGRPARRSRRRPRGPS